MKRAPMASRLPLLLIALAAAAFSTGRAAERISRAAFSVGHGATLKVDTYRGSIDVQEATDGQIHIEGHVDPGVDDPVKSEQMLQRLQLEIRQEGNTVSIVQRNPRETGVRFVWENPEDVVIYYVLQVPPGCNVDLATNGGGITVGNLTGSVDARAKNGSIFLRRIDGSIHASTEGGDIVVSHCVGSVVLKALLGGIRIGTVTGHAELHATNGDIEVQHALGGLNASTEMGDVTAAFPAAFNRDSSVKTNGGAITVRIDPAAHCSIQASSIWGKVRTTLPIAVDSGGNEKRKLAGRLNGGGALMVIHADGGQVHIDAPKS